MKKKAAVLLSLVLITAGVLAGCGNGRNDAGAMDEVTEENGITGENGTEEGVTGADDNNLNNDGDNNNGNDNNGSIRTGVAIMSGDDLDDQNDQDDADDQNDVDDQEREEMTVAAVVLHADGRVARCIIDETQYSVSSTADDQADGYQTKQELGENYGMKKASSINKEWHEQADAFAKYCEGKTADEIRGIAVTDDGYVKEADLAASCTIEVDDFKDVVIRAINNAEDSKAGTTDKIGVGVVDDAVAAVTLDGKGKITSIALGSHYMNNNAGMGNQTVDGQNSNNVADGENTNNTVNNGDNLAEDTVNWLDRAASYVENIVGNTVDDLSGMSEEDREGFPEEFGMALTKAINNAK